MSEIYFTADTHFGHAGIIWRSQRPFESVEEQDHGLIQRWNDTVRPNDEVYHLGDFAHKCDPDRVRSIFRRLHGKKHLIVGNHDGPDVRSLPWASPPTDRVYLRHPRERHPIVLDHYALRTWSENARGAAHLYGHSHGTLPGFGRSLDVGVDCWDYRPVSWHEIKARLDSFQRPELPVQETDPERAARRVGRGSASNADRRLRSEITGLDPTLVEAEAATYAGQERIRAVLECEPEVAVHVEYLERQVRKLRAALDAEYARHPDQTDEMLAALPRFED